MTYLPMTMPSSTKTRIGLFPEDYEHGPSSAPPSEIPAPDPDSGPITVPDPPTRPQRTLLGAGPGPAGTPRTPGHVASAKFAYFFPPPSQRPAPIIRFSAPALSQPRVLLVQPPARPGPTLIPSPPMDRMAITLMGVSAAVVACVFMLALLLTVS